MLGAGPCRDRGQQPGPRDDASRVGHPTTPANPATAPWPEPTPPSPRRTRSTVAAARAPGGTASPYRNANSSRRCASSHARHRPGRLARIPPCGDGARARTMTTTGSAAIAPLRRGSRPGSEARPPQTPESSGAGGRRLRTRRTATPRSRAAPPSVANARTATARADRGRRRARRRALCRWGSAHPILWPGSGSIVSARRGGTPGATEASGGAGSFTWRASTVMSSGPTNGSSPTTRSTRPRRVSTGSLRGPPARPAPAPGS